jgi:hypothetical protein
VWNQVHGPQLSMALLPYIKLAMTESEHVSR